MKALLSVWRERQRRTHTRRQTDRQTETERHRERSVEPSMNTNKHGNAHVGPYTGMGECTHTHIHRQADGYAHSFIQPHSFTVTLTEPARLSAGKSNQTAYH